MGNFTTAVEKAQAGAYIGYVKRTAVMKTHLGIPYKKFGEDRVRSLCGRSSSYALDIEEITAGANVTFDQEKVTCKFCQRLLPAYNSHSRRAA